MYFPNDAHAFTIHYKCVFTKKAQRGARSATIKNNNAFGKVIRLRDGLPLAIAVEQGTSSVQIITGSCTSKKVSCAVTVTILAAGRCIQQKVRNLFVS